MSAAIAGNDVAITVESMFSMNRATATISGTMRLVGMPHVTESARASTSGHCVQLSAAPHRDGARFRSLAMIYLLAVLLPPVGLLLNGQPFAAIFNLILIVPCILLGFIFPVAFLVPSLHAVIAVHMKREDRKHRELVNAIERHGPPPGWRP